ncbi:MAG: antA/AntB antirepressor family protein, partial [Burkholderiales bacterium]|nr:antA/AntB antirepressor family protein [Burkholderiales bacterium]
EVFMLAVIPDHELKKYDAEIFTFNDHAFRYCHDDKDQEWFCASDICHYLGYEDAATKLIECGVNNRKRLFVLSGQALPCISKADFMEVLERSNTEQAVELFLGMCGQDLPISFDQSEQPQTGNRLSKDSNKVVKSHELHLKDSVMNNLNLGAFEAKEIEADMLEDGSTLSVDSLIVPKQVVINGKEDWVIDAKELYSFLNPASPYSAWIRYLIRAYGYQENIDFVGSPSEDLYLSLPVAREICMTEPKQAGRQARFYIVAFQNKHRNDQVEAIEEKSSSDDSSVSSKSPSGSENTLEEKQSSEGFEASQQGNKENEVNQVNEETEVEDASSAEEETSEEYLDLVEASKDLGVGIQFLYQYLDDIGWLIPGTDEPRIWAVHQGWMVYDIEQADGGSTPGLLTSEGFDVLENKLVKLGIITLVP